MSGFLPENPGVLVMDIIAEIRRRHFIENETITSLAEAFKLSRPTIRKHLKTIAEPVYQRQNQPHPKLGPFHEQLEAWLEQKAHFPRKQRRTAQRLYECLQVEGYRGSYTVVQCYVIYKEYHRGSRMQSRHSGNFTWEDQDGDEHTVTWGNSFGEDGVEPGPVKYADYGFSHSCEDACQWDYIRWYQEVRQHDVIGPYGPYDNYPMWLLVPGQEYDEYVLTMYESSPLDYLPAAIAWVVSQMVIMLTLRIKTQEI
jgi:DNA-binding transcriptional ArsR family regulator